MTQRTEQKIMQNWEGDIAKPLVSISCITYNHEDYIAEAIDSFLMQETDFPFEIVVRDDCSTDNTAEIIREYAKRYPHLIKPIYEKENQYSKGVRPTPVTFKKSVGEYIALCEGDDYWIDPGKLQIQVDLMRENPECHLSFHPADEVIDGDFAGNVWGNLNADNKIFTDSEMITSIPSHDCPTASMVFRREVMDPPPNFFASAPTGDIFLQHLGSLNGGALFIARNMSAYRVGHHGSWSTKMLERNSKSVASMIENRTQHVLANIKSLEEMKNSVDRKHSKDIDKLISLKLYGLSRVYLENGMDIEYKKTILQARKFYMPTTIVNSILYNFRFAPNVFRYLVWLRNILSFWYSEKGVSDKK